MSNESSSETLVEPTETIPEANLDDLPQIIRDAVARMGWKGLMPVQSKSIPYLRAGRDLMVQSQTGSGKTGAFLLPMLERIDTKLAQCQVLILVPTRELARQVNSEATAITEGTSINTVAVYGGVGYGPQLDALRKGAHIVVGTPGRILDHLLRRSLILDDVHTLIFDEADRMLSVGFYPDIKAMEAYIPKDRNSLMFSATYPPSVLSLSRQFLRNPEMLSLSRGNEHAPNTVHLAFEVPAMEKDRCLVRLIEIKNPESAIIFCNTKAQVRFITVVLQRFGYDADQLSADLTQGAREKVLERVYKKKLRFLVATDVAARGIDIDNLSHVFLYDFPEDPESYIHRTGRTGRAGASGEAVSLVTNLEKLQLKAVSRLYGVEIPPLPVPTDEEVAEVVSDRVTALLEAKLRNLDNLMRERLGRMLPLASRLGENDDERAIVAMMLDEYYQKTLHETPELPPAIVAKEASAAKAKAKASSPPPEDEAKGEAKRPSRRGASSGGRRRRPGGGGRRRS